MTDALEALRVLLLLVILCAVCFDLGWRSGEKHGRKSNGDYEAICRKQQETIASLFRTIDLLDRRSKL